MCVRKSSACRQRIDPIRAIAFGGSGSPWTSCRGPVTAGREGSGSPRDTGGPVGPAAAINPSMVSALGINTGLVYSGVFVLGGMLAGLAGGLAAPVRSLTAGMGFSILIESFIVTVIGGMGSVAGALVGSLLIGLVRSFGTIGFPLFTEGLMFLLMAVVLVLKPSGLFGRKG